MPGVNLLDQPFYNLLPGSIRDDETIKAAATALDRQFAEIATDIEGLLIWSRIDTLEEPLLDMLAWQWHLEDNEGWALAQTVEQKRDLIKQALPLHMHKGTRFAVEQIFTILNMPGKVVEWWQAPAEDFPPYTFDIDWDVSGRTLDETFNQRMMATLNAQKNVRSHLRKSQIYSTQSGGVYIGLVLQGGVVMEIRPFDLKEIIISHPAPHMAAMHQSAILADLTPFIFAGD